jgi:hypothetical protein
MRDSVYEDIREMAKARDDDYMKLAHYIWRLGATLEAVNRIVEAMVVVPSLRQISGIKTVLAPAKMKKSIDPFCMSPHELLHGIVEESSFQNPTDWKRIFSKLFQLDQPLARPINSHMSSREKIVTRVHAELQIADKFSRSMNMEFVGNDRYIGCSKPACYFCYNWLRLHRHFYVQPATHHKIIPGCRAPDDNLNETGANVVLEMYSKISRQIGQDIMQFLNEDAQPRHHYMSTEGSSPPTSLIWGM